MKITEEIVESTLIQVEKLRPKSEEGKRCSYKYKDIAPCEFAKNELVERITKVINKI